LTSKSGKAEKQTRVKAGKEQKKQRSGKAKKQKSKEVGKEAKTEAKSKATRHENWKKTPKRNSKKKTS